MNITNLSNFQLDMLKEIGNIGAGNAATSLSKLINKRVDMQVPSVKIVPFEEVMNIIGGPDQMIVAILFQIQGDIRSEEHTSELQSRGHLVCRLLLEKKKNKPR